MNKKKGKKREWSEIEDRKFIQVWSNKYQEFCGPKKNSLIYKDMVADLATMSIEVTVEQVRLKISNFIQKYRALERAYDPERPPAWPFYEAVGALSGEPLLYKRRTITAPQSANNMECSINVGQDYETLEVDTLELTTVKSESSSTPTVMNEALSDCSLPESCNETIPNILCQGYPTVELKTTGELNTTGEQLEQGIAALLTVCNRLSENIELHLSQSLAVEKQKLKELRAIRLAKNKENRGLLGFFK